MARDWTEDLAKKLCWAAAAMVLLFVLTIAARVAARFEVWRPPDTGMAGTIALWVCMALGLLFGMDRGIPRDGVWSFRLYVVRKLLVAAILGTVATMVYLK